MVTPRKSTPWLCERCGAAYQGYGASLYCGLECRLKSNVAIAANGCWVWQSKRNPRTQRGSIEIRGKWQSAPRVAYATLRGPIPEGMAVCHVCDNPACINPDHLFLGSQKENMRDAAQKRRTMSGERHTSAKLTEGDVRSIRASEASTRELARSFGVDHKTIREVRARRTWRHV